MAERPKRKYVKITCKTCGKEFEVYSAIIRQYAKRGMTRKYCSHKCSTQDKDHPLRGHRFGKGKPLE